MTRRLDDARAQVEAVFREATREVLAPAVAALGPEAVLAVLDDLIPGAASRPLQAGKAGPNRALAEVFQRRGATVVVVAADGPVRLPTLPDIGPGPIVLIDERHSTDLLVRDYGRPAWFDLVPEVWNADLRAALVGNAPRGDRRSAQVVIEDRTAQRRREVDADAVLFRLACDDLVDAWTRPRRDPVDKAEAAREFASIPPFRFDPTLPPDRMEFRDRAGNVVGAIVNIGPEEGSKGGPR